MEMSKFMSPEEREEIKKEILERFEGLDRINELLARLNNAIHFIDENVFDTTDKKDFAFCIEEIRLIVNSKKKS